MHRGAGDHSVDKYFANRTSSVAWHSDVSYEQQPPGTTFLYILDKPTTGLHAHDTRHLLGVLQRLVDAGNSVVVIEHNLDVVKCADWVLDLGPEGGDAGGQVVAEGTPEEVAQVDASHTGRFLRPLLSAPSGPLAATAKPRRRR